MITALRAYRDNEDGNIAIMFGLTLLVFIAAIGTTIDYSIYTKAEQKSQDLADATALHAAILVKNLGHLPISDSEGFLDGVRYKASDLGHKYGGFIDGDNENIFVTVKYDTVTQAANVIIEGATKPIFMGMFGHKRVQFKSESSAAFEQVSAPPPTSIVLALDNSLSMGWDDRFAVNVTYDSQYGVHRGSSPADAITRISSLKTIVKNYMATLEAQFGKENFGHGKKLRIGMIPYSGEVIEDNVHPISWGYIPDTVVDRLEKAGSTNSYAAIARAQSWMNIEDTYHTQEALASAEPRKDVLKYVVLMSDGRNSGEQEDLEVVPGPTGRWYAYKGGRWNSNNQARNGYIEGHLELKFNRLTREICSEMKLTGVQIYTIGYGLQIGHYAKNNGDDELATIGEAQQEAAYGLLEACASSSEHFFEAGDSGKLQKVFTHIGRSIVEEVIRLKS